LTECLVLGELVGRHAAKHASDKPAGLRFSEKQTNSIGLGLTGSGKLNEIRTSIRRIAWDTPGIVRSQTCLQKGLSMVEDIVDRLGQVEPENIRQVLLKQDLTAASFTVKAVLVASLARTESRGSFYRSDFPLEDGANWLKNSCLSYSPEREQFFLCHRALTPAPLRT
jgi:succinate dehydrogenase/fumarate reductase flavoprotein subunit